MTRKATRRTQRVRGLWLWSPVALLAALFAAPACGPEFTGCDAYRSCNETGGTGGSSAGGTGGSSAGSGGTSGRSSAGTDAGGETGAAGAAGAGGNGEAGAAGLGGSGGSGETGAAGAAGAGGAGGVSEPCADEGTVECAAAASAFVRTCTAGVWARKQCAAGSLCDGSDATCKAVVDGCVDQRAGDSFCEGDKRRVCGPDLVTTTDQVCEGACVDGACKKPACGDGKIEGVESCDDGNLTPGDGCNAICRAEPVAVELGATFGCALLVDQRLKCWGDNRLGQLGLGDALARGDQAGELGSGLMATLSDVTAFAVGPRHACAVSKAETWCWGDNSKYALGTGSLSPTLSRVPIQVALGGTPIALAAGEDFTCGLLADHSLRCWGSNTGEVFGAGAAYQPATAQAALPRLVLGSAASAILAGQSLCANSASGLVCSGALFPSAAYSMNLGPGFTPAGASSGAHHDCAWSTNGKVHCWGAERGPLGLNGELAAADGVATASTVPLAKAVSALDAGVNVTCAVLSAGEVECWGSTETGVLGRPDLGATIGSSAFLGDEAGEIGLLRALELGDNGAAKAVAVGQGFACALLKRGALKCWGSNAYGQLGHGDTQTAGDQVGEMGNALPDTVFD